MLINWEGGGQRGWGTSSGRERRLGVGKTSLGTAGGRRMFFSCTFTLPAACAHVEVMDSGPPSTPIKKKKTRACLQHR